MSYIGSTPTTQSFIEGTDYFNGDGSTTAFTLSRSVVSVNDIQAVINNVVQQPNTAYTVSGTTITFTSAPSAGTSNIYVRYLSTTTQSITPSQNTVSYNTLNSDTQSKLGISFKNRLINPAMVIDQRNAGASVATSSGSGVYTVDRWIAQYSSTSKFTVQQSSTAPANFTNSVVITSSAATSVTASAYYLFSQRLEGYNVSDLAFGTINAKTITLSFWVRSSLTGTFGGVIGNDNQDRSYPFSYTINSANTWEQKSITIPGDQTGTWAKDNTCGMKVWFSLGSGSNFQGTANAWTGSNLFSVTGETQVVATNGATWYLAGTQLEIGTQATTFDYRSIGTELQLCQRYYWQRTYYYTGNSSIGVGQAYNSNNAYGVWIQITNEFRATPTLTTYPAYSTLYLSNSAASGSPTQSSGSYNPQVSAGGVYWDISRSGGGLTAGNAVVLYAPSANATFGLSAEL